jgi:hypothetical protein
MTHQLTSVLRRSILMLPRLPPRRCWRWDSLARRFLRRQGQQPLIETWFRVGQQPDETLDQA